MSGFQSDSIELHSSTSTGNLGGDVIWVYGEMFLGCVHVRLVRLLTELVATAANEVGTSGQMLWG